MLQLIQESTYFRLAACFTKCWWDGSLFLQGKISLLEEEMLETPMKGKQWKMLCLAITQVFSFY